VLEARGGSPPETGIGSLGQSGESRLSSGAVGRLATPKGKDVELRDNLDSRRFATPKVKGECMGKHRNM